MSRAADPIGPMSPCGMCGGEVRHPVHLDRTHVDFHTWESIVPGATQLKFAMTTNDRIARIVEVCPDTKVTNHELLALAGIGYGPEYTTWARAVYVAQKKGLIHSEGASGNRRYWRATDHNIRAGLDPYAVLCETVSCANGCGRPIGLDWQIAELPRGDVVVCRRCAKEMEK